MKSAGSLIGGVDAAVIDIVIYPVRSECHRAVVEIDIPYISRIVCLIGGRPQFYFFAEQAVLLGCRAYIAIPEQTHFIAGAV